MNSITRRVRLSDREGAFGLIESSYGTPTGVCILGDNIASMSGWAGLSVDRQYEAVTRGAGVFPCGGMYYLEIEGPDACNVLNCLTPREIGSLAVGQATFCIVTTTSGCVETEALVLRTGRESYIASIGGDTRDPTWLADATRLYPDARLSEADVSSFNIKGPMHLAAALTLVADADKSTVGALRTFRAAPVRMDGETVWVLKTEIGLEMWAPTRIIKSLWQRMLRRPDLFVPCGWDLLATYRLECSSIRFNLCPVDINHGTFLHDVDLGHVVTRRKPPSYVGAEALRNYRSQDRRQWQAGLTEVEPRGPVPEVGARVYSDLSSDPGYVTTAAYSPVFGKRIAFALLPIEMRAGATVELADGSRWVVSGLPFDAEKVLTSQGHSAAF
ncbi:glycine cleavage T C-terminal barrel domain-containing protein [Kribbella sp. NPDC051587]|uniref:glycine cleavage T C-terminal barrel domain-containing protein n=1 Tax=Kribbella sp. NPDC051587 TaxID=3364119 RepID=UPI00379A7971